jgi:hypothetical protein
LDRRGSSQTKRFSLFFSWFGLDFNPINLTFPSFFVTWQNPRNQGVAERRTFAIASAAKNENRPAKFRD